MPDVLILGGTAEALQLAKLVTESLPDFNVITSLAGRTQNPAKIVGTTRFGGFGGVNGLVDYLKKENIQYVVDATHPFAAVISEHCHAACEIVGIPHIQLKRPAWSMQPEDNWIEAPNLESAAKEITRYPDRKRIFLATGHKDIKYFSQYQHQHQFLVRLIDKPTEPLCLDNYILILDRGPFSLTAEIDLLQHYQVNLIISKNSGGSGAYAKIEAARILDLPVIMVRRPQHTYAANIVETVDEAMLWLEQSSSR